MDDRGGLTSAGADPQDDPVALDGAVACSPHTDVRIEVRRFPRAPDLGAMAAATGADVVWLDSSLPDASPDSAHARARWSVLALTDGPFAAGFRHEARRAVVETTPASHTWFGPVRGPGQDRTAFEVLHDLLEQTPVLPEPIPGCGFALGWVGYLGYELGRESGGPDRTADGHADADLRFVDRAVVVDAAGGAWALALVADAEPSAGAENRAWLESVTTPAAAADVVDAPPFLPSGLEAAGRVTRAAYETAVDACRAEIREGNAFQVCLTTAFAVGRDPRRRGRGDARAAHRLARVAPGADPHLDEYLRLRTVDPVPFGAYLRLGPLRVASRSPERFLRVDAAGAVSAEPIKGTRRRADDPVEDEAIRLGLASSEKDRAENVMIVDLLRNDLLRTAVPGSVHVDRLCAVETYASVHQMVSTIGAVLPAGTSRAAVVRAAFPPGSMTGAPKISAMAIADRLEGGPRGVYSGVLGYFSASGAVDLSVVIRTLVTVVDADGAVVSRTFGAGGAVTWSSVAADEADEVETKTRSVLSGVGATARW